MMKQFKISLLTITNVATLLACIYHFTVAYNPLIGFICGGLFLSAFITAIQMTPKECSYCKRRL